MGPGDETEHFLRRAVLGTEDTSPRPATDDLFFGPSPDERTIVTPPRTRVVTRWIPVPLEVLAMLAGWWFLRRRRRARS